MKNIILFILISCLLPACSIIRPHKLTIEQGNVISQQEVKRLQINMTPAQVKDIMGQPVLVNIFSPNRIDYVYTLKAGHENMTEKRVTCIFQGGRLKEILKN